MPVNSTPNDWGPASGGLSSTTYDDSQRSKTFQPRPPKYLSAAFTKNSNKLSVTVTVGNGGVRSVSGSGTSYNIYFVLSGFLSFSWTADQLLASINGTQPIVTMSANSTSGNVTYVDYDHVNIAGYYLATILNNKLGVESTPAGPCANPIDFNAGDRVIPPEVAVAGWNKTTETAPGSVYTDTRFDIGVVPNIVNSLLGYQVYIKNYNNDPTMRESILMTGRPVAPSSFINGEIRLPTDAAGHTIYFYLVPIALSGDRRPDPQNSYYVSIPSGP